MNKKGAEANLFWTIAVLVLILIALAVIIYGFGTGWKNLWNKLIGYTPAANVDSVRQVCQYACTTNSVSEYCSAQRDVYYIGGDGKVVKEPLKKTCSQLITDAKVSGLFEKCDTVICPVTT